VIRAHPGNLFSTFPPLAQLIYAVPLAAGAVRAPALLHLLGYCTAAIAAQGLASRLGASRLPAFLAGLCILYLPVAPLVAARRKRPLASLAAFAIAAVVGSAP